MQAGKLAGTLTRRMGCKPACMSASWQDGKPASKPSVLHVSKPTDWLAELRGATFPKRSIGKTPVHFFGFRLDTDFSTALAAMWCRERNFGRSEGLS
jgi:hypothetical protein